MEKNIEAATILKPKQLTENNHNIMIFIYLTLFFLLVYIAHKTTIVSKVRGAGTRLVMPKQYCHNASCITLNLKRNPIKLWNEYLTLSIQNYFFLKLS